MADRPLPDHLVELFDPANPSEPTIELAANFDPHKHTRWDQRPSVAEIDLAAIEEDGEPLLTEDEVAALREQGLNKVKALVVGAARARGLRPGVAAKLAAWAKSRHAAAWAEAEIAGESGADVPLVVEDGSGVAGANTYATIQEAAAFHEERGALAPATTLSVAGLVFGPGGAVIAPSADAIAGVVAQSLVHFDGGQALNTGYAYVRAVDGAAMVVDWLDTVAETPAGEVEITAYQQAGFWADTPARIEAALVNAAELMSTRYAWAGERSTEGQGLAWPRMGVYVVGGSPYHALGAVIGAAEIPPGVPRCQCWLALADLDESLRAPVDPRKFLVSKSVGPAGIVKTFGGQVRLRRFPHADVEVAGLCDAAAAMAGRAYYPIVRV